MKYGAHDIFKGITLFLFTILITNIPNGSAFDCPTKCKCPVEQNYTADCSSSALTIIPSLSSDVKFLDLSNNALGPIINETFPPVGSLVSLDLSHNGLTQLLGCTLRGMLGLKRLSLRGNRLMSLPDSLFEDADDVEYLDLSDNAMVEMPDGVFRNLAKLMRLDLSNNRLVNLKLGLAWQVPRHLQHIDLSHNAFTDIDQESFQMANGWEHGFKRTLNLANCRLASIQCPAISKIPGVNDLDLSGNTDLHPGNLTSVIKELETKGLEKLSLSNLNLTTIESFFSQVTQLSLKFLNVSDNAINHLPANTFSTISGLRVLDMSRNRLTSLEPGFSDLRNLKVLNISFNAMTSFNGDTVTSMRKIRTLDLSNNQLANPAEVNLNPLTNLVDLDLNTNLLTGVVIPQNTDKLTYFDYHSNAIRNFSGFTSVPKLEYFDMSDNDLEKIQHYLFKQSRFLKVVNFSRNSVTQLDEKAFHHQSSLVIDLSHNFLKKVQVLQWVATQELYLNNNEISELDIQTFYRMTGLRVLDLAENKLSLLNEDILEYTNGLQYLNLSHNALHHTYFFRLFRNLENLEVLDLANNNVSHLNESMLAPLPKLKQFYISNNHLETIKPRVFRDLNHVKELDLSGNPFLCNCENLAFQDWISRTKLQITGLYARNSSAYDCKAPASRVGVHITDWTPDQFECDQTILYMIICASVGVTLIIAGVVSTILYRIYKCHKRKKLEREKARFRAKCYAANEDEYDDNKNRTKGGKLDLALMTSEEIAEEIANAIERRERRSLRKAEEMKKKNANGYAPWPPTGTRKVDEKIELAVEKPDRRKENGRRESIEARQYDRIMQMNEESRRYAEKDIKRDRDSREGSRGPDNKRYSMPKPTEEVKNRPLKIHRSSGGYDVTRLQPANQHRYRPVRAGYSHLVEPEPDYGYQTEPAPRRSTHQRYGGPNRWDSLDIWDREARGWMIMGQGQRRSRSHGPRREEGGRERYMTLPIRDQEFNEHARGARRGEGPRMYLDQGTNEVRFGMDGGHPYPNSSDKPPISSSSARHSRWDAYYQQQQQQRQQHQQRSRSFHYLPQEINGGSNSNNNPRMQEKPDHQQHGQYRSLEDDKRPLIGPRAVSQPYLVSENTSDWL